MLRARLTLPLVALLVRSALPAPATSPADALRPTDRLGWMAGCWSYRDTRGRLVEEQWSAPRAGVMFGYSRTTRARPDAAGDTLLLFETSRISETPDGGLVFAANPSGQQPDEFRWAGNATALDSAVTFENPAHDFPQRVRYRRGRATADSLIARVEGARGGAVRGIDFPYARARCES